MQRSMIVTMKSLFRSMLCGVIILLASLHVQGCVDGE
jgi:hypothetical protein